MTCVNRNHGVTVISFYSSRAVDLRIPRWRSGALQQWRNGGKLGLCPAQSHQGCTQNHSDFLLVHLKWCLFLVPKNFGDNLILRPHSACLHSPLNWREEAFKYPGKAGPCTHGAKEERIARPALLSHKPSCEVPGAMGWCWLGMHPLGALGL